MPGGSAPSATFHVSGRRPFNASTLRTKGDPATQEVSGASTPNVATSTAPAAACVPRLVSAPSSTRYVEIVPSPELATNRWRPSRATATPFGPAPVAALPASLSAPVAPIRYAITRLLAYVANRKRPAGSIARP